MNLHRLRDRLRHDGLPSVAAAAAYRALRTLTRLHIVRVFRLTNRERPVPKGFDVRLLSAADVRRLSADPVHELAPFLAGRVDAGLAECYGLFENASGDLASFVWLGRSDFPAEWIYGPPLEIPADTAYLHNAVTVGDFRGRGLYPALAAAVMRLADVRHLLFTVEYGNRPSLRAAGRMGAEDLGSAVTLGMPYGRTLRKPEGLSLRPRAAHTLREHELPG